jgi:oxygen-independent coproporphyrinogen-3 oxidase
VIENAEIALEANPDDLTKEKLSELKNAGINRLSIGVQSFFDKELKWMNRSHDAMQAENCIRTAKEIGFDNITIDLIYGVPGLTNTEWKQNLQKAIELNIDHLSCYALTVEPKTALYHQIEKDKLPPLNEQQAAEQFEILMAFAKQTGFKHYEISNFARDKKYSKHNTSYWKGNWYLGIGPSAHSFNASTRQWNIANNALYIKSINEGEDPAETEILTIPQQYNEFVMISLRTMWGLDLNEIKNRFDETYLHLIQKESAHYIQSGDIVLENEKMKLSDKGKLIADKIISDLFFI